MQRVIGWALVALQFVLLVALVVVPRREPNWPTSVLGALIVLAGVALGFVAFRALGSALTPTPVPIEGVGLRTDGLYAYVRHPIYSAVLLMVVGYLVALGSLWSVGVALALIVFFWLKSRWEDQLLAAAYGAEWTAWAAQTGALIPRHRRRVQPPDVPDE
jgi:protein-S-isoprenylcysteine O-methyltransferase Ste14